MNDSQILSTLDAPVSRFMPGRAEPPAPPLVFDACHVGLVLRAVLFVQAVVAVTALFQSGSAEQALLNMAALTAVAQPAVLAWLSLGCLAKRRLAPWSLPAQVAAGVALGAGAGVFGFALWDGLALSATAPGLAHPMQWLASALAGALVAGVMMVALVWRVKAQLPAGTEARLAELQSRIRPHFLFNTLNSAIALVRAEPARAEALLEDLSELFRSALADPLQQVTLAHELHLAQRYMAIEQVRFGERLRVHWALDPAAGEARLPPLVLQPLVENAVKHGVEPSATGADIRITTERRGDAVVIKVANTMPGGAGAAGNGLALANVGERLALVHDLQASFRYGVADGVFLARLEVPA